MDLDPKEIDNIRSVSRTFVRELGLLEQNKDISLTQCHVLIELGRLGVLNIKELAELLHVDSSTMSRTIKKLAELGWVEMRPDINDKRARRLTLTLSGQEKLAEVHHVANDRVSAALDLLNNEERRSVADGMQLYVKALTRSRMLESFTIRAVQPVDDVYLANIIRTTLAEYGAVGPDYAYADPEVDVMYATYNQPRATYFVVVQQDKVVGGGGVSRLRGAEGSICELQKMYFVPEARGYGLGAQILRRCLDAARGFGFKRMYLETLESMFRARRLYERFGFQSLAAPLGNTGHGGCNSWMALDL